MAGEVSKPHDHLFRSVFGEKAEAAGLLRAHLPEAASGELLWSSLQWQSVSFIDGRLRDSESDLLYADRTQGRRRTGVAVRAAGAPVDPERWHRFADAVRREVPGGGELMSKTEEMLEIYGEMREQEGRQAGRQEGRREGELRGKVLTIEGFLGRDVPWTTIEAATGVDQATFGRLKQRLEAADDDTSHWN